MWPRRCSTGGRCGQGVEGPASGATSATLGVAGAAFPRWAPNHQPPAAALTSTRPTNTSRPAFDPLATGAALRLGVASAGSREARQVRQAVAASGFLDWQAGQVWNSPSAWVGAWGSWRGAEGLAPSGVPQPWQNRALSPFSAPHAAHAAMNHLLIEKCLQGF